MKNSAYKTVNIKNATKEHMANLEKDVIHIFTDGSCVASSKEGGWGCILIFNEHKKTLRGWKTNTTVNEMELEGIFRGIAAIKEASRRRKIVVYSDSKYCICCLSAWHTRWAKNGWKTATGKDVKNKENIKKIVEILPNRITFRWVKGHAGHEYNEIADELAGSARKEKIEFEEKTL